MHTNIKNKNQDADKEDWLVHLIGPLLGGLIGTLLFAFMFKLSWLEICFGFPALVFAFFIRQEFCNIRIINWLLKTIYVSSEGITVGMRSLRPNKTLVPWAAMESVKLNWAAGLWFRSVLISCPEAKISVNSTFEFQYSIGSLMGNTVYVDVPDYLLKRKDVKAKILQFAPEGNPLKEYVEKNL